MTECDSGMSFAAFGRTAIRWRVDVDGAVFPRSATLAGALSIVDPLQISAFELIP